jgi:cytochrome c-type biogenesis protein CcmH
MLRQHRTVLKGTVLVAITLLITQCAPSLSTNTLEDLTYDINKSLICPVCPGETIDQSQVELAKQMRQIVIDKVNAGWDKDQILQFFVDRYGKDVLAEPPKKGFSLILWIVPPALIILSGIGLVLILKHITKSSAIPTKSKMKNISKENL